MRKSGWLAAVPTCLALVLSLGTPGAITRAQDGLPAACRYGITAPYSSAGYPLESLGVSAYLDWRADGSDILPDGVEYIRVLRVSNSQYDSTIASLPAWVIQHPASVWIIGNEPDRYYYQDSITAEVYAQRYYELASIIRSQDPTAKLGFGSVVQPTPIRIRYLQRAWNRLAELAGGAAAASRLIDIWSIHAFILNEALGDWGAGIPVGFEQDHADAIPIYDFDDTHSAEIFAARLTEFRAWLAILGERGKPLWVTEYGSLFPPIDPPGGPDYVNVSDALTAGFMLATFDYMDSATNATTGMPSDGNHLVQRWFWYSLNDYRYNFGGSLFDPDNSGAITPVGTAWQDYQASHPPALDIFPRGIELDSLGPTPDGLAEIFQVSLHLGNSTNTYSLLPVNAWLYEGDPDAGGTLIAGPLPAATTCGGFATISTQWTVSLPLSPRRLYLRVALASGQDANPANNTASYLAFPTNRLYLPQIYR